MNQLPTRSSFLLYCLTACLAAQAYAAEVYIHPTITGYIEQLYNGEFFYSRSTGILRYGEYASPPSSVTTDHAFLKFSLDSLPDSCVITGADLVYYQYEHTGGLPVVDIRLIRDPMAQPPHDAWFGIVNGRVVASEGPSPDGSATWQLDSTAGPLLDSCRRAGVASFGIHWSGPPQDTYSASAYGYDSSASPYLHVVYAPSAIHENRSRATGRAELTLVPNPTNGTFITITCGITASANLTLRDALGRTLKSFLLPPSGRTRLDLRALAPGVYIATLRTPDRSVSRKLVISR